ncbi:gas vesicle protein [Micromonospora sp. PLK6-60]|uniref:gas vesicle protein n=1 Tax=Micromonospora sp. PLK6-60 TaxID=2873383 RepID=UPI001CA667A5|nr:gas vesicle protein [Micromonospora sp. PLK6-60]MBY8873090.1 gas vesicle protein [Micromonospora sp. PLK6-60]
MVTETLAPSSADDPLAYRPVALVDLLDRVLATGVVISGEITIAIADIDLVYVSLRALISSVGSLTPPDVAPDDVAPDGVPALPAGGTAP